MSDNDPAFDESVRTCEGCGCTDVNPCLDDNGVPCDWVPREEYDGDLCTRCAAVCFAIADAEKLKVREVADHFVDASEMVATADELDAIRAETARRIAERLCTYCADPLDEYEHYETACDSCRTEAEAASENNAPLVELYTEGDANRAIAELRGAR